MSDVYWIDIKEKEFKVAYITALMVLDKNASPVESLAVMTDKAWQKFSKFASKDYDSKVY